MNADQQNINILIVDDEPANIKILMPVMIEKGYEVRTALTGTLAISSAIERRPDMILLDVRMPDMDGFKVCRKLKSDHRVRSAPIIFISALGETQDIVQGLKLGGADYITKPFRIEEVLARVETHLSLQMLQNQLKTSNEQLQVEVQERLAAEKALKALNEQLEQRVAERTARLHSQTIDLMTAKEAAEAANIAKNKFLSNLSHELRTPLNPIMGYAQIIQSQSNLTEEQKEQLQVVCDSCIHLTKLISDMLELVRLDAHQEKIESVVFNIKTLIKEIVHNTQRKAQDKNISVCCEMCNSLPEVVYGDGRMLHHVLMYLLDNAIKFTDFGSVTLRVNVIEGLQTNGKWQLLFEIIDTGVGVAQDIKDDIFLPFFQGEMEGRLVDGTGLGLTLSRKLVAVMGGRLSMVSPFNRALRSEQEGPGSIFTLKIDFGAVGDDAKMVVCADDNIQDGSSKQHRLLIVDDSSTNLNLMVHALEPLGFELLKATNGQEALRMMTQNPPDLILLDLLMPGMDGADLVPHIRRNPDLGQVKIIGVSAAMGNEKYLAAFVESCDDFIEKPIEIEKLLKKVRTHLSFV